MKPALVIRKDDFLKLFSNAIIPKDAPVASMGLNTGTCVFAEAGYDFYKLPTLLADRSWCENNPDYLQVLPYVTLIHNAKHDPDADLEDPEVFIYSRGKAGEENRLHGNCSIGIGGHMEHLPEFYDPAYGFAPAIIEELLREIEEEVGLKFSTVAKDSLDKFKIALVKSANQFALLYSENNDVGLHHLCVHITLYVDKHTLGNHEEGVIQKGGFNKVSEILKMDADTESGINLEDWSRSLINVTEFCGGSVVYNYPFK